MAKQKQTARKNKILNVWIEWKFWLLMKNHNLIWEDTVCASFWDIKNWETLPQSVLYSRNDPGFAFLNKEYVFLASQKVYLMQRKAGQTLETQAWVEEKKWLRDTPSFYFTWKSACSIETWNLSNFENLHHQKTRDTNFLFLSFVLLWLFIGKI